MKKSKLVLREYQGMMSRIVEGLKKKFREVVRIEYPEVASKKAVDVVIGDRGLLRIYPKLSLRHSCIEELKHLAKILGMPAIAVANHVEDIDVLDEVVHVKHGIKIVNERTMLLYLNGAKIFVYEYRGSLYTRIDGKKLRELRLRRGLSLGELAEKLKISRKALYQHEQGRMDMSIETAERLLEIFPEEAEHVFASIDLFASNIIQSKGSIEARPRTDSEAKVLSALAKEGAEVAILNYSPPDVIARVKGSRILIVSDNIKYTSERIKKIEEVEKMSSVMNAMAVAVGESKNLNKEFDTVQFVSPAGFKNLVRELVRSSRA
ncbi:MAG: hypothetical protein DRO12_00495 [Thermoprotei archaeon]|nr:MAG: hypothetical protein DRO12_00495 [Thermoprotei archaeon]